MRIIMFAGGMPALDIFTYQLRQGFIDLGCEVMVFDAGRFDDSLVEMNDFIKLPVNAAVTFNNLGYNMTPSSGECIWDTLRIPMINILVDHPYGHQSALDASPGTGVVLVIDRTHLRYLTRFYPQISITGFLPHGGQIPKTAPGPLAERSIDIIYTGGLSYDYGRNMMPDLSSFPFDAKAVTDRAMEIMFDDNSVPAETAIETALKEHDVCLPDDELKDVIGKLHYIDCFVVSHYREKLIRSIVDSGLRVTVVGNDWGKCDFADRPNFDYRGLVSPYDIMGLMLDSKIVLSTTTWFKDGSHERVFNGLMAGALVFTDYTPYYAEEFTDDEVMMFRLDEIDGVPQRIKALLDDPEKMQKMADRGHAKAEEKHSWAKRAEEIYNDLLMQI